MGAWHSGSSRGDGPLGDHAPARLTRREVLAALPLAALAACRRPPGRPSAFMRSPRSRVVLLPATSYDDDFTDLIGRGLGLLGVSVSGTTVLLKPNLVEYESGSAINTHPAVLGGAAEAMRMAGAREVVVGEGPGHRRDVEYLLGATGLGERLRDLHVPFVDLNLDDVKPVELGSRFTGISELLLPSSVLRADLVVSVAKLKTHHWAGMTASMKNLFGVLPGAIYGWPKNILHVHGIDQSIVDLNATIRPGLAIVDAVVAMEGDGPIMGRPRQTGFVAMGTDPVAVDATCARVMGLDPEKLEYLKLASDFLGHMAPERIDQAGERIERYAGRFDVVERLRHLRLAHP